MSGGSEISSCIAVSNDVNCNLVSALGTSVSQVQTDSESKLNHPETHSRSIPDTAPSTLSASADQKTRNLITDPRGNITTSEAAILPTTTASSFRQTVKSATHEAVTEKTPCQGQSQGMQTPSANIKADPTFSKQANVVCKEEKETGSCSQGSNTPSRNIVNEPIKKKRSTKPKKSKANLRKGKWTVEEEEYTTRIIQHFRTGLLALPNGHTLRSFLAEKLNCDPMRITKKFSGASCLGKRVYNLCDRSQVSPHDQELARAELRALEQRFRMRIEHGNSLPLSSHMNTIQKLALPRNNNLNPNELMNPNYLFMKNTAGSIAPAPMGLNPPNMNTAGLGAVPNFPHIPLAFLQSIAAQQQDQRNNQLNNAFQIPNQQIQQQIGNNMAQLLSLQQSLNPSLLSTLINSQVPLGQPAGMMNASNQPFSFEGVQGLPNGLPNQFGFQNQLLGSTVLPNTNQAPNTNHAVLPNVNEAVLPNMNQDQNTLDYQMARIIQQNQQQPGPRKTDERNEVAIEALAATYNQAATMSSQSSQNKSLTEKNLEGMLSNNRNAQVRSAASVTNSSVTTKGRTQEEEDAGRTLLGFMQELQSNHLKAISTDAGTSISASHNPSQQRNSPKARDEYDTTTTFSSSTLGSSLSDRVLKRGYDISVQNSTGNQVSSVPRNEALSGSSNGEGSSESSSSDSNQDQSGSDAEKEVERVGPLRKRFRLSTGGRGAGARR